MVNPNLRPHRWVTSAGSADVHVFPSGETHTLDGDCECSPKRTQEPNCLPVYTHRSAVDLAARRPVPDMLPVEIT